MIPNKRHIQLWLFLLLVVVAVPSNGNNWDPTSLIKSIASQRKNKIEFIEEKNVSFVKQKLISSGLLVFQPPDILTREIFEPEKARFVVKGKQLTIFSGDDTPRTVDLDDYPQSLIFIDTFRAILAGDAEALQRLFEIQLEGDKQNWTIHLYPRSTSTGNLVTEVIMRGQEDMLNNIETRESGGDYSLMRLIY